MGQLGEKVDMDEKVLAVFGLDWRSSKELVGLAQDLTVIAIHMSPADRNTLVATLQRLAQLGSEG